MNVYDFDKTLYPGDSTVDFYLFCLKKKPSLLQFLPKQITGVVRYKFKKCDKTAMKQAFFCFLAGIDTPSMVEAFWRNNRRLAPWYQPEAEDVVISASPRFLIQPFCSAIGITHVIASEVDEKTGRFQSPNCRGEEKVLRFRTLFPVKTVDGFYSDSLSDTPMARLAEKPFFIRQGKPEPWPDSSLKG